MEDYLNRRELLGAATSALLAGCTAGEEQEHIELEELIEDGEEYHRKVVETSGWAELLDENPIVSANPPARVYSAEYELHTEQDRESPSFYMEAEQEYDELRELDEGDLTEDEFTVVGRVKNEFRNGEEVYMMDIHDIR